MAKHYMMDSEGSIFTTENPDWHPRAEKLSTPKGKLALAEQSKSKLREILAGHPTMYFIIRSVSTSGMSRTMDIYVIQGSKLRYLTALFSDVLGWGETPKGALKVSGCGMDMCFHTAYTVYSILGFDEKLLQYEIL